MEFITIPYDFQSPLANNVVAAMLLMPNYFVFVLMVDTVRLYILAGCAYSNFVTLHCITVSAFFCLFVFFRLLPCYTIVKLKIWAASVGERLLFW